MGVLGESRWAWVVGPALLCVALAGWLWPIGLGGAMPVGGDVTSFQIGLMAVLGEALREGRLPFWNDRWGFGFPGLAESQMGVYYPPHLVLFGLLSVEAAYAASMVLHVLWGGLGARWAARRFGVSGPGAVLSGVAWGASGFFLIHLSHQWAYTVGSWTPWAWGLGWSILSGTAGRRSPWLLAAVLAIQLLPGHFQLAFCTQVSLLTMAVGAVLVAGGGRRAAWGRAAMVVGPLLGGFLLASAQVVPTFRLARLAETQRDFEYLSGFAATPLHLVNLVAPELFHRSPLWRPIAWDPFHTSPEENLLYVGLVPLFLALGAIVRPGPDARAVRVLVAVLAVGLGLGLGPYLPGFGHYAQWPGFSFFRAPARWGMVATLALAILAGLGLDAIREGRWRRPGLGLLAFVVAAAVWVAVVLGIVEIGLGADLGSGRSGVMAAIERTFALRPWEDGLTVAGIRAEARRPQNDLRVIASQANAGLRPVPTNGLRFDRERWDIYRAELTTTAALLVGAIGLAVVSGRRRAFVAGLFLLAVVDLGLLARRRPIDSAPIRPLTEQSVILGRMAAMPEGTRSIDPTKNLAMVAGVAPVSSYRTLDLPILGGLLAAVNSLPRAEGDADALLDAQRALGARIRIIGPIGLGAEALAEQFERTGRLESAEVVEDPALTGWLFGAAYAGTPEGRAGRYVVLDAGPAPRAWLVPTDDPGEVARLVESAGEPSDVLSILATARPLELRSESPGHLEVVVGSGPGRPEPGVVLVTQLDHPDWRATWSGGDSVASPGAIDRVLGGWQGLVPPRPMDWTLRLDYDGRAERWGLALSAVAWAGWGAGLVLASRRPTIRGGANRGEGPGPESVPPTNQTNPDVSPS